MMKKSKRRKHASAKDGRLWRTYGIREAERAREEKRQRGRCKICGKSKNVKGEMLNLCVDHDHKARWLKITCEKIVGGNDWCAFVVYKDREYQGWGRTKSLALKEVRHQLKRRSVRGLICWPCNRAIRAFSDDPVKLRAAAEYLEWHQQEAWI